MTAHTDYQSPILPDVPNRSSTVQPTEAHYYRLTGGSGADVASLIVELDDDLHAVRGDLCFFGAPAERDGALRLAQNILAKRYADSGKITPLDVFTRAPDLATIPIAHEAGGVVHEPPRGFPLWIVVLAMVLVFLVLALVAQADYVFDFFTGEQGAVTTVPAGTATPRPTIDPPTAVVGSVSIPPNTNGLPPSRNADGRLAVGMTVVIDEGMRSYVRTEPGANQGEVLGYLQDGESAIIQGGPVWLPGDSDTIVWWEVTTIADGVRGWTPANTSQLTLLVPAPQ
jgi:hypothetical protein